MSYLSNVYLLFKIKIKIAILPLIPYSKLPVSCLVQCVVVKQKAHLQETPSVANQFSSNRQIEIVSPDTHQAGNTRESGHTHTSSQHYGMEMF